MRTVQKTPIPTLGVWHSDIKVHFFESNVLKIIKIGR